MLLVGVIFCLFVGFFIISASFIGNSSWNSLGHGSRNSLSNTTRRAVRVYSHAVGLAKLQGKAEVATQHFAAAAARIACGTRCEFPDGAIRPTG